jgi:hypothetical protein
MLSVVIKSDGGCVTGRVGWRQICSPCLLHTPFPCLPRALQAEHLARQNQDDFWHPKAGTSPLYWNVSHSQASYRNLSLTAGTAVPCPRLSSQQLQPGTAWTVIAVGQSRLQKNNCRIPELDTTLDCTAPWRQ